MNTAIEIINYIDNSSILSSLFVSLIISIFLIYIFRWPKFSLTLDLLMKGTSNDGCLDFTLVNKKKFMSYDSDEVYFSFYVPLSLLTLQQGNEFIPAKEFVKITKEGGEPWNPLFNIKDRSSYNISGVEYLLIRSTVKLDVFPNRKVLIFRLIGNFNKAEISKVYYWFSTKHGIYPHVLFIRKFPYIKIHKGKFEDVLAANIPYAVTIIREYKNIVE